MIEENFELVPIEYYPKYLDLDISEYVNTIDWVHRDNSPRLEYYWNKNKLPYTYGSNGFSRTYESQNKHHLIENIRNKLLDDFGVDYDTCFANYYRNQQDHLGWHSDNSDSLDNEYPIAIISMGVEREIWFRDNNYLNMIKHTLQLKLKSGSLCIMKPGMQLTHQHRIPKCDRVCGERISLTFRVSKNEFN